MTREVRFVRWAGLAGSLVAPLVLTFAVVGSIQGHAFASDVLDGGDSSTWIAAVRAHPVGWRITMSCLIGGFVCMLGCAHFFFHDRCLDDWRRVVSLVGYSVGVPAIVVISSLQIGRMWWLSMSDAPLPSTLLQIIDSEQLQQLALAGFVGPALIVAMGSGLMAWCALRIGIVARWVCWLGMLCGVLSIVQMFQAHLPILAIASVAAGPLHMIWFSIFGIALLLAPEQRIAATDPDGAA